MFKVSLRFKLVQPMRQVCPIDVQQLIDVQVRLFDFRRLSIFQMCLIDVPKFVHVWVCLIDAQRLISARVVFHRCSVISIACFPKERV